MATNCAYNPRPQYFDLDGNPLSGGRLTFYEVGSVILKPIYAEPSLVTELPNPLLLDIGGFVPTSGIWYGPGNYKMLVEYLVNPGSPIPVYAEQYTVPIIVGGDEPGLHGSTAVIVDAVIDIPNLDIFGPSTAYANGYYSPLDNGGGFFRWMPDSTAPDDLGSVISSVHTTSGRWIRLFNDSAVMSSQWGVVGGAGTNMVTRLGNAAVYSYSHKVPLVLTAGEIECAGTFTLRGNRIIVQDGFKLVRFSPTLSTNMELIGDIDVQGFNAKVSWPNNQTILKLSSTSQLDIFPGWFGAVGDGIADDFIPLFYASVSSASSLDSPVVLTNSYKSIGGGVQPALSFPNLICKDGAQVLNSSFAWYLTGTVDVQGEKAFGGNLGRYYCDMSPRAHWFVNTTPTEGEMVAMCQSATRNGLSKGTLVWDSRSYTIPNCADSTYMQLVTHEFANNAKWTAGGTDAPKAMQMANTEIELRWFDKAVELQQALYYAKRNNAILDCHFNTYTLTAPISLAGSDTPSGRKVYLRNCTVVCSGITQAFNFSADYVNLRNVKVIGGFITAFGTTLDWYDCYFSAPSTVEFLLQGEFGGVAKGSIVKCVFEGYKTIEIQRNSLVIRNCEFNNISQRMKFTGNDTLCIIEQNSFGNIPCEGPPTNPDSFAVQLITPSNMRFNNNSFTVPNIAANSCSGVVILGNGGTVNNFFCEDNYFTLFSIPTWVVGNNWQMLTAMNCAATGHRASVRNNKANHPYPRTVPAMSGSDGSHVSTFWQTDILYESMCFGTESYNNKNPGDVPNAVIKSFYKCILPNQVTPTEVRHSDYIVNGTETNSYTFTMDNFVISGGTYTCSTAAQYTVSYSNPLWLSSKIGVAPLM